MIIIDDLDKLDNDFAEKIFLKDPYLLMMVRAKIICTFPLETYYFESKIKDRYDCQFIPLVIVDEDKNGKVGVKHLRQLILKRIDRQYVSDEALTNMILSSGGLLRDLIKMMQDACKQSIVERSPIIDQTIAQDVINELINHYERLFDSPNYEKEVQKIIKNSKRNDLTNKNLIYLLKYLFILEYRFKGKLWYDVHPCLRKVINAEIK